uniref:Uncharacterized protein n=1 Tax=Pinguiococcus pyrenoidosus TaxID=172671 RepID=A0A7R9U8M2_9STRA|mmetsp:Transcript_19265/g.72772  ORF Transcript_19265/g.72772 Transcript_19265/m.72772 type:complete len:371 (+) Transcript_19265:231-1343(+)
MSLTARRQSRRRKTLSARDLQQFLETENGVQSIAVQAAEDAGGERRASRAQTARPAEAEAEAEAESPLTDRTNSPGPELRNRPGNRKGRRRRSIVLPPDVTQLCAPQPPEAPASAEADDLKTEAQEGARMSAKALRQSSLPDLVRAFHALPTAQKCERRRIAAVVFLRSGYAMTPYAELDSHRLLSANDEPGALQGALPRFERAQIIDKLRSCVTVMKSAKDQESDATRRRLRARWERDSASEDFLYWDIDSRERIQASEFKRRYYGYIGRNAPTRRAPALPCSPGEEARQASQSYVLCLSTAAAALKAGGQSQHAAAFRKKKEDFLAKQEQIDQEMWYQMQMVRHTFQRKRLFSELKFYWELATTPQQA